MSDAVEIREAAPNIHCIKVPLPNNPLKFVNSYLILGETKPLLIDVGFSHPECERALSAGLSEFSLGFRDIDVLFTHGHPDHTGCIERIYREEMHLYAHMHSFLEMHTRDELQERTYLALANAVYEDEQGNQIAGDREPPSAELLPIMQDYPLAYLKENDVLERGGYRFRVIETPGHAPAHICLYDEGSGLFISGDHVLQSITPNISSFFLETDALQEYLDSLSKVRDLNVNLILPAHGVPFTDLAGRVDELKEHHRIRLSEMEQLVLAGYHDLVQITSNAHWKYPNWHSWGVDQKLFSLGETLVHLVHAVHLGRLRMIIEGVSVRFEVVE